MLAFVFIPIVVLIFAVIMVAMRPTKTDKAIEHRISSIRTSLKSHWSDRTNTGELLKPTQTSRFEWLESVIAKSRVSRTLHANIEQAQASISVGALLLTCLGLAVVCFLITYGLWRFLPVALAVSVLVSSTPFAVLAFKRSKRLNAFNTALPEGIDMMGRALRAGHSMQASIEMVSTECVEPIASEFAEVFKQQNFGLPLREALLHLLERVPSQDLRVLVTAILVQRDTGGNLAEILDRTSLVIRERIRIKKEIQIHTAQGRMTGWILSLLPLFMFVVINIVSPGYSHVLLVDPFGQKLIYIGIGLTVTGALVIRGIVNGIDV